MCSLVVNHGFIKIIESVLLIGVSVFIMRIALNPEYFYEKFNSYADQYKFELQLKSKAFREKAGEEVKTLLNHSLESFNKVDSASSLCATNIIVYEFHNGLKNPSGLGFEFAAPNYEASRYDVKRIYKSYEQKDIRLMNLNMPKVMKRNDGIWCGTVPEFKRIDPDFVDEYQVNDPKSAIFILLKSNNSDIELGVLAILFQKDITNHSGLEFILGYAKDLGVQISDKIDASNMK